MARFSTMHRLQTLLAVGAASVITMASCSGGGSSTAPGSAAMAKPQVKVGTPAPLAANRTAVGTTSITLKLPAIFKSKNGKAVSALHVTRTASGSTRKPAYVNPTSGYVIDIWVNGTLASNLDGQAGSDSLLIQSTLSGVQAIGNVPLYSTGINYIDVFEYDGTYGNDRDLLAFGETTDGPFTAGTAQSASVTLQMNAQYIGVLNLYNQDDPEEMSGQAYFPSDVANSCAPNQQTEGQLAFYPADATGAFVAAAGYGGTLTPTITSTPLSGGTSVLGQTTAGIYQLAWDANCDGVQVSATASNPAYPAYADATDFAAPVSQNQYGYYYCYYNSESCPAGPYQGLWDLYNGQGQEGIIDGFGSQQLSGTITVTPTAEPSGG